MAICRWTHEQSVEEWPWEWLGDCGLLLRFPCNTDPAACEMSLCPFCGGAIIVEEERE